MPKLYYTTSSCGAANFIAARLAGVDMACEQVDLGTHKTSHSDSDFYKINPKGNVPTIVLKDGTVLNENAATLQFIADQDKDAMIIPAFDTTERYQVINALSYIGTELHTTVGPLFNPTLDSAVHESSRHRIVQKWTFLNDHMLHKHDYLVGNKMSVADIYLYIVLSWSPYLQLDYSGHPNIVAFFDRMKNDAAIKDAHAAMASDPTSTMASNSSRK